MGSLVRIGGDRFSDSCRLPILGGASLNFDKAVLGASSSGAAMLLLCYAEAISQHRSFQLHLHIYISITIKRRYVSLRGIAVFTSAIMIKMPSIVIYTIECKVFAPTVSTTSFGLIYKLTITTVSGTSQREQAAAWLYSPSASAQ